ncbi:uncharacterized protein LOC144143015 [Haemaphysalis longicornis]
MALVGQVLAAAGLLLVARAPVLAQSPGCWNEQMADKQRLQYGLMLVRQQIANMLTLDYIASVTAQPGSPLGVSLPAQYHFGPARLHEPQQTLVLPASGQSGSGGGIGFASHVKSTTFKKEVPLKDHTY